VLATHQEVLMGKTRRTQPKKLASKLKKIRRRLDWSQEQMANRLRKVEKTIYPGLISRFEQGKAEPSLIVLLEYSRIAGVSMESLVDDKLKL
jgi:transcriptional regulator with XRE-family HTH domain